MLSSLSSDILSHIVFLIDGYDVCNLWHTGDAVLLSKLEKSCSLTFEPKFPTDPFWPSPLLLRLPLLSSFKWRYRESWFQGPYHKADLLALGKQLRRLDLADIDIPASCLLPIADFFPVLECLSLQGPFPAAHSMAELLPFPESLKEARLHLWLPPSEDTVLWVSSYSPPRTVLKGHYLNQLPNGLEVFELAGRPTDLSCVSDFSRSPRSLRKLSLVLHAITHLELLVGSLPSEMQSIKFRCCHTFGNAQDSISNLKSIWKCMSKKNLQSIAIGLGNYLLCPAPVDEQLSQLPPGLTHLEVSSIFGVYFNVPAKKMLTLFPRLQNALDYPNPDGADIIPLLPPTQRNYLAKGDMRRCHVNLLPRGLLELSMLPLALVSCKHFHLPPALQVLQLSDSNQFSWDCSDHGHEETGDHSSSSSSALASSSVCVCPAPSFPPSSPPICAALPSSLTQLEVLNSHRAIYIASENKLPDKLRQLVVPASFFQLQQDVNPTTFKLPHSLTRLRLTSNAVNLPSSTTTKEPEEGEKEERNIWHNPSSVLSILPPFLHTLELFFQPGQLEAISKWIVLIPSHIPLTKLFLSLLPPQAEASDIVSSAEWPAKFPNTLRSIEMAGISITSSKLLFSSLPPKLRTLTVRLSRHPIIISPEDLDLIPRHLVTLNINAQPSKHMTKEIWMAAFRKLNPPF